jgi:hypothetical protein
MVEGQWLIWWKVNDDWHIISINPGGRYVSLDQRSLLRRSLRHGDNYFEPHHEDMSREYTRRIVGGALSVMAAWKECGEKAWTSAW